MSIMTFPIITTVKMCEGSTDEVTVTLPRQGLPVGAREDGRSVESWLLKCETHSRLNGNTTK